MIDFNDQRCSTCIYWQHQGAQIAEAGRDPSCPDNIGTCHHRAPVVFAAEPFPVALWPRTEENRWCGDWEPLEDGGDGGGEKVVPFQRPVLAA